MKKTLQVNGQVWDTFLINADFNYLASIGINTVRIPIGYELISSPPAAEVQFDLVKSVLDLAGVSTQVVIE